MKTRSKIKWAIASLLAITIVPTAVGLMYIDSLAKLAIERGGTYAMGVETTLAKIDIGLFSGKVSMSEFNIANPSGFTTPHFMRLGEGRVAASLSSLAEPMIELPELALSGISLNLEHRQGKSNYQTVLDNLEKLSSGAPAQKPAEQPSEGGGRKFVIRKVSISDVNVTAELTPIGGALTRVPFVIDSIELRDVGSESGGVIMSELTGVIVQAILTAVVQTAGEKLPAAMLGELTNGLASLGDLGGATLAVAGQMTELLGQSVEQIGKTVDGAGKDLGKSMDQAGKELEKSIGSLLGAKKEDKKDKSSGGG